MCPITSKLHTVRYLTNVIVDAWKGKIPESGILQSVEDLSNNEYKISQNHDANSDDDDAADDWD